MSKATFVPNKDYTGPAIELVCGRHTKDGKFRPKNIKLTSIARLNKFEKREDRADLYIRTMKAKNPSWSIEAAEQRWQEASKSYYDYVREVRIETRLNANRQRTTQLVLIQAAKSLKNKATRTSVRFKVVPFFQHGQCA